VTTIPLAPPLLAGSSDRPGDSDGPSGSAPRLAARHRGASLFGLAPCGVLPATRVTTGAVRSYRTFSPLPTIALAGVARRYIFCATFLQVALTGRYPAHCPAEFGLSSRLRCGVGATSSLREPARPPRVARRPAVVWLTANIALYIGARERLEKGGGCTGGTGRTGRVIRLSLERFDTARVFYTDCCAACRSLRRSSRCSIRSRAALPPDTPARHRP
jgi:hypothetical protein